MLWDNTSVCFRLFYLQKGLKNTKEMERTVSDNGCTPAGPVLSLEYRARSRPDSGRLVCTTEHGRTRFLLVEPAYEVNEKGTKKRMTATRT